MSKRFTAAGRLALGLLGLVIRYRPGATCRAWRGKAKKRAGMGIGAALLALRER